MRNLNKKELLDCTSKKKKAKESKINKSSTKISRREPNSPKKIKLQSNKSLEIKTNLTAEDLEVEDMNVNIKMLNINNNNNINNNEIKYINPNYNINFNNSFMYPTLSPTLSAITAALSAHVGGHELSQLDPHRRLRLW